MKPRGLYLCYNRTMADIETFDVYEMAAGTTYPEDKITIYLDGKTAKEFAELDKKTDLLTNADKEEMAELEEELTVLKAILQESKLDIYLRGIPLTQRKAIAQKLDSEFGTLEDNTKPSEDRARRETALYAISSIQKIVNYKGEEASVSSWDADKMDQWLLMLPDYYRTRLVNAIGDLTFKSDYYEKVEISTDF